MRDNVNKAEEDIGERDSFRRLRERRTKSKTLPSQFALRREKLGSMLGDAPVFAIWVKQTRHSNNVNDLAEY